MSRRVLLLCAAVIALGQQVEPVYRTGTQLVVVDVAVHGDKGPVKGLTKDDFTIQDKGKAQTIAVFAANEKGTDTGKATPLPQGVVSNRVNAAGESVRTATVILFDRLNILEGQTSNTNNNSGGALSGLGAGAQARAGRQVLAVLASLNPSERIGLYSLFQDLTVVRDFTEDAGPLIAAAKRALAMPPAAGSTAEEKAMDAKLRDALTPGHPLDHSVRAEITGAAFRSIARRIDGIPGRKSLIWIASSFPLNYGDADHRPNDEADVNNYARVLGEANIALFSLDPRGAGTAYSQPNSASSDSSSDSSSSKSGNSKSAGSKGRASMTGLDTQTQGASGLEGVESMQLIASQTGGKSYINVNDIAGPIHEVIDAAEVSYTLGFYVDDKAMDGRKHDIGVKLSKKGEAGKLTYRKSYVAAAHPERAAMKDLIASRLDANRIGLMAASAAAPNRPGVDVVQVHIDLKDLQFEKRADKWFASFDLALAIESGGEPKVSSSPNNLSLTDDQLKQGLAGGVTIDNMVPAPDKAATVRVVVQDQANGEAGAIRVPLPAK